LRQVSAAVPRGDRHSQQIRIHEQMLAARDALADGCKVEGVSGAAEEAVRNPEPRRRRAIELVNELPMRKLGCVYAVEDGGTELGTRFTPARRTSSVRIVTVSASVVDANAPHFSTESADSVRAASPCALGRHGRRRPPPRYQLLPAPCVRATNVVCVST
jgi:hypothetical protein